MKWLLLGLGCILCTRIGIAQERTITYNVSQFTFISTRQELPFWLVSNRHGLLPNRSGNLWTLRLSSDFVPKRHIQFAYGLSGAVILSPGHNDLFINECYASAQWRNIRLDIGMIHPEEVYNGLSSTNGNIMYSGNTRPFPGFNFRSDFISLPSFLRFLSFKGNWAEYLMQDDRYVHHTRLHNKSFHLKITLSPRLEWIIGQDHWAQWAGTSPLLGRQPASFRDYVRIFFARSGSTGASASDSLNALGNHLGRQHLQLNYRGERYTLSLYHDIPFEDGSGTDFRSFPDGTYCLYYGAHDKRQVISNVIYEFYYTKYQSGSRHDRPATPEEQKHQDPNHPFYGKKVLGGNDDYFNNGEYKSGWTYYHRTIGSPFLLARPEGSGWGVYNNRLIGHYLALKGLLFRRIPYKAQCSYTINYGRYVTPLPGSPRQFSFGLETKLPLTKLPFTLETGLYGDFGQLFKHNLGILIRISRSGIL